MRVFVQRTSDHKAPDSAFRTWARGVEREVVALDGKTVRRSGSRRHDHGPLHVVSAWASDQGLALGQRAVDGKSNEIVAIPELLETLHLEGCIVALDAMGCQKDIAAQIRVLSGLAPAPLVDKGSIGYRAASHEGGGRG